MKENGMAPHKILIVEDEEDIHELLLFTMRRAGHQVIGAKSGEEAITILGRETFDLIILDIMLPHKNGFEVLAFLQNLVPAAHTRVILLSAMSNSDTIVKGLTDGAVDYITKPFSINELMARVKLHLQLKTANDELRLSEESLRQSLAAKEKFFRIIAHDLRGPVSALHGYAKLLTNRHQELPIHKKERCLQTLEETSASISALLENLLQWAQSQTDNLIMQPETINLLTLCTKATAPLLGEINNKNIRLALEIPIQDTIYADPQAIATVIRNLLANAIKYSFPDSTITLSSRIINDQQEITIADSGVGIDPADIDKLFNIDTYHSTPGTCNEKGTGLGLILCREFIKKNHGMITVHSTPGKGSAFIFTLPRGSETDTFNCVPLPAEKQPDQLHQQNIHGEQDNILQPA